MSRQWINMILSVVLATSSTNLAAEILGESFGDTVLREWDSPEARQYDFWLGEWDTNWRFWQSEKFFHADLSLAMDHWMFTVLDGKALIELGRAKKPDQNGVRIQGFSIRYLDPHKDRWVMAQNWPGPNESSGFLDQLQGSFRHGRGELFSGVLKPDGTSHVRRYTFSDITSDRFRWDSNTTTDQGTNWKVGTIVEGHRKKDRVMLPAVGRSMPGYDQGKHCSLPEFKAFDSLEGAWHGTATFGSGQQEQASLAAARYADGCAVMAVLRYSRGGKSYKLFQTWTYHPDTKLWIEYRLDNQPGTVHEYRVGRRRDDRGFVLEHNDDLIIDEDFAVLRTKPELPSVAIRRTLWSDPGREFVEVEFQERKGVNEEWRRAVNFALKKR